MREDHIVHLILDMLIWRYLSGLYVQMPWGDVGGRERQNERGRQRGEYERE